MSKKYSVLFVCLGNICRSPLAEEVFRELVSERELDGYFEVESCGTGPWHVGKQADARTREVAKERGIDLEAHRARQVDESDFGRFDLLVAMDEQNFADLQNMGAEEETRLVRLRDYDPKNPDDLNVPDPYYGSDGFERVHDIIERCCEALLDELEEELT